MGKHNRESPTPEPVPAPTPVPPTSPSSTHSGGPGPLIPRNLVSVVALGLLGFMGYSVVQHDYKSTLVLLIPLLFILGADISALFRAWRGTPDPKDPM